MAKSKAKKMREHLVRQGKNDPGMMRLNFGVLDGVTKRPPVPSVVVEKKLNKHKNKRFDHGDADGGTFYYVSGLL